MVPTDHSTTIIIIKETGHFWESTPFWGLLIVASMGWWGCPQKMVPILEYLEGNTTDSGHTQVIPGDPRCILMDAKEMS